ncbi:expressed unknown protein [Seminavis robusta]|uniref:Uncharacterized protein n=1 Tax=Seminavis robusta TaxID=568900 RepID=A0A9N8F4V5_9STRA|nr:expressed unknown protein [Seminavis robusta]|eukprot:Sro3019_g342190.1 n/a (172) ;mRNA; r:8467-8982
MQPDTQLATQVPFPPHVQPVAFPFATDSRSTIASLTTSSSPDSIVADLPIAVIPDPRNMFEPVPIHNPVMNVLHDLPEKHPFLANNILIPDVTPDDSSQASKPNLELITILREGAITPCPLAAPSPWPKPAPPGSPTSLDDPSSRQLANRSHPIIFRAQIYPDPGCPTALS